MKTKIIVTGILLCVIAACGITNSQKFNPHLNGLWKAHHLYTSRCSSGGDICGRFDIYWYALINYPKIHLCKKEVKQHVTVSKDDSVLSLSRDSLSIKEELKITHNKGNIYRIKLDNGNVPENNSSIITVQIHRDGNLEIDRNINNTKFEVGFPPSNRIEDIKDIQNLTDYQKCGQNAEYSSNIFNWHLSDDTN